MKNPPVDRDEVKLRLWMHGVLDANVMLQRHVGATRAALPPPLRKALADVDWACRALTTAVAAWQEAP